MSAQIQYGPDRLPTSLRTGERPASTAETDLLFSAAVRCGRRKSDQVGHLVLTSAHLEFRGPTDLRFSWLDVSSVDRVGRDVVVAIHHGRRVLRFGCQADDEAIRGTALAAQLARLARGRD